MSNDEQRISDLIAFKAVGDKYYNSSIKIKNFIKNGK